ncbi:hypothetical protein KC349_g8668 [Hortaea werneckii]|nr:hypothetical protein KC349_g8668 [Hortaea werneckii]
MPPQVPPQQQPTRPQYPPQAQSQQNLQPLPYPISDDPPPYSSLLPDGRPHSHSQPPPMTRPPLQTPHHSDYQYRPQQGDTHMYPPEKQAHFNNAQQNGFIPPGNYAPQGRSSSYQQPPGRQGYPFPNGAPPPAQPPYATSSSRQPSKPQHRPSPSPYRNDSSRSRSRSRSREKSSRRKHRPHYDARPQYYERPSQEQQRKKSNGVSTFLGAGGGAVLGDIIFPGLGTLGGAILGGVGGHEYGKQRRSYSNDREYYEDNHGRGRRRHERG